MRPHLKGMGCGIALHESWDARWCVFARLKYISLKPAPPVDPLHLMSVDDDVVARSAVRSAVGPVEDRRDRRAECHKVHILFRMTIDETKEGGDHFSAFACFK